MKKFLVLLLCVSLFISCKNETKSTSSEENTNEAKNEELTLLKGEFVYYDGAAVLQTPTNIYGVLITDKMLELNKQAETYKTQPTDMVPVEIKGKITNKKDDKILWENKVEVIEILNVTQPNPENNNVVKLGQE